MKSFRHTSLQSPTTEIRLLDLEATEEPNDIRTTLTTALLEDKPFYIAISYEWGEIEPLVDIQIDGKVFRARHNLWLLLYHIKVNGTSKTGNRYRRLWIDALCIDQNNVVERNAQVQLMGSIYRQADSVLSWLGWGTDWDPKETFGFIRQVTAWGDTTANPPDSKSWLELYTSDRYFHPSMHNPFQRSIWESVLQFCQCKYWSRRWIVQEVLLAREVTILCGRQELPWAAMGYLFKYLHNIESSEFGSKSSNEMLKQICKSIPFQMWIHKSSQGSATTEGHIASLPELLRAYHTTECDVLYDRIFSLMSLAPSAPVKIDYSCSRFDFIGLAISAINDSEIAQDTLETLALAVDPLYSVEKHGNSSALALQRPPRLFIRFPAIVFTLVGALSSHSSLTVSELAKNERPGMKSQGIKAPRSTRLAKHRLPESYGSLEGFSYSLASELSRSTIRGHSETFRTGKSADGTKFILCTDGSWGIGSGDVEVGDLVCRLDSDKYLLLGLREYFRPSYRGLMIVGIAEIWRQQLPQTFYERPYNGVIAWPLPNPFYEVCGWLNRNVSASREIYQLVQSAKDYVEFHGDFLTELSPRQSVEIVFDAQELVDLVQLFSERDLVEIGGLQRSGDGLCAGTL